MKNKMEILIPIVLIGLPIGLYLMTSLKKASSVGIMGSADASTAALIASRTGVFEILAAFALIGGGGLLFKAWKKVKTKN